MPVPSILGRSGPALGPSLSPRAPIAGLDLRPVRGMGGPIAFGPGPGALGVDLATVRDLAGLFVPLSAGPQTLCVQPSGGATGAPCTNAVAYTTIQAAVAAANAGDQVLIANGTYQASSGTAVVSLATSIALRGGYSGGTSGWTTQGYAGGTVIDGQGVRSGISVASGVSATVQGLAVNNGGIQNSGTVTVDTGTLILQNGGNTNGTLSIATGATLSIPSGTQTLTGGTTVSGAGTLLVNGGTLSVDSATVSTTISNSGTLYLDGYYPNPTTVNAALDNFGTVVARAWTDNLNGPYTSEPGSTVQVQGNTAYDCCNTGLFLANGFTNHGLIDFQDASGSPNTYFVVSSGTLTNAPDGTITAEGGAPRTMSIPSLVNQGQISLSLGGGGLTWNGANQISNSGTISATGGTLTINETGTGASFANTGTISGGTGGNVSVTQPSGATFTQSGSLSFPAGQTLSVSGGSFALNAGSTETGGGTLALANLTATFSPSYSTSGLALRLDSATLNGPGTITNAAGQTLYLDGYYPNATTVNAALDNFGTVVARAWNNNLNGAYTSEPGSTLQVQGNSAYDCCNTGLVFANGFTNHGLIDVQDATCCPNTFFTVSSGTLTNAPDGTISAEGGAKSTFSLLNLANQGRISLSISGTTPISGFPQFTVSGNATLGGTLTLSPVSSFTPTANQAFQVLNFSSRTGFFSTINSTGVNNGLLFNPYYSLTNLTLNTSTTPDSSVATIFASGFPSTTNCGVPCGPIGLAFDQSDNLYVSEAANGGFYRIGPSGTSSPTPLATISGGGITFGKDGQLYTIGPVVGTVVAVDLSSGAILRTVVTGLTAPLGLATDPLSGDLFVSQQGNNPIVRISNFAAGPGTVAPYSSPGGDIDGLTFGPDGTLYAALRSQSILRINGTNTSSPGAFSTLASVAGSDGVAVATTSSGVTSFVYANSNNGFISRIDLSTSPPAQINVFSGGSRGDFVAVGFDGCLYATQSTSIVKLTRIDGTCNLAPTSALPTPTVTSTNTATATLTSTPMPMVWATAPSMPSARYFPGAATGSDGRVYVVGGFNSALGGDLNAVEAFDPIANAWSAAAALSTARFGLGVAAGADGRIYAIGGARGASVDYLGTAEVYDPRANAWSSLPGLPTARAFAAVAAGSDGKIYAFGGLGSQGPSAEVDVYDPTTGSWATLASLPAARFGAAATRGGDGQIYVIGGRGPDGQPSGAVTAYNPSANTWSTIASLLTASFGLGAATGADGRIYALGGDNGTGTYLSTVEVYTPSAGTWASFAALPTAREGLAVALSPGGQILALGGVNGQGTLGTVESFSTVPNTPTPTSSPTATITPTATFTATSSPTGTPTLTPTSTVTPTPTMTSSPTMTPTPSQTGTSTITSTVTPTSTATSTPIGDSVAGFSSTQGLNNWCYGYYQGTFASSAFQLMPQFISNIWYVQSGTYWTELDTQGGSPNATITSGGRTPVEQWAVRRWISPVAGTVLLSGHLAKADTRGGVGITGHIYVDGTQVYTQFIAYNDAVGVTYSLQANVQTGSVIDYAIQPGQNDFNDSTVFTAQITGLNLSSQTSGAPVNCTPTIGVFATATPTPSSTPSTSPTPTQTATGSPSASGSPTITPTGTPTASVTPTSTATAVPLPDLVITAFSASPTTADQPVPFSLTIVNQGTASTGTGFSFGLYVDLAAPPTTSSVPLFSGTLPALNAGQAVVVSGQLAAGTLSAGNHTLWALADSTGAITESNKANNTASIAITVGAGPTATITTTATVTPTVTQTGTATGTPTTTPTITVTPSGPPPSVSITSPADGGVVTSPTTLTGSVSSATLASWSLAYRYQGTSTATTFATGTTPVANSTLGSFDPTLLLNGQYEIDLTATDASGQTTTTAIDVVVDGQQKVGNFTLSFTDLSVPVAGLPIQVVRTYDSRDKASHDFGYGWSLDVSSVKLQENEPPGQDWFESSGGDPNFPTYCLQPTRPHVVSVVRADGTVDRFQPVVTPSCQQFVPITTLSIIFQPLPGTTSSLSIIGDNTADIIDAIPGNVILFSHQYDQNGLPLPSDPGSYRLTLSDGRAMAIDRFAGLKSISDLNGNTLTVSMAGITSSAGKGVSFTRDLQDRITKITDPSNNALTYAYDASGNLASVTDQVGNTTTFTYDGNHRMLTIVDPRGVQPIRNDYDSSGRLISSIDANGKTITYSNNLSANTQTVTDRLGDQTSWKYNDRGNIIQKTDAIGNVTNSTYDNHDNMLSTTDPLGNTSTYTYDFFHNLDTATDPLGRTTTYTYDRYNGLLTTTDPLGRVTTNTYDGFENLLSTKDPLGNVTSYTYTPTGLKTSMTDPMGNVTRYAYDSAGNLTQETDALGHVTTYTHDANGNRLTETRTRTSGGSSQTLATSYQYDGLNRLVKTTYPDGSTAQASYNSIGKPATTTDQLGRVTTYTYDTSGRLVTTTYPDGTTESSTYDAEGHELTTTDQLGRVTTNAYDLDGRLTSTAYADGTTTNTAYDAMGRTSVTTDPRGNMTKYAYDAAGHQTSITDGLGHVTTFAYDVAGNQTSLTDALNHTTAYQYDANNRQNGISYPDGTTQTTTYDALGRRIAQTDQAGVITRYGYDALGRLTIVTDALNQVTSYGYDELGNQLTQTDANGHTTSFAYDQLGRRTGRTLPLGMAEAMAYDAAGNLSSHTDFNGKTTTYSYDALNRLLSKAPDSSLGQPTVRFAYTSTGQRASMQDASGTTTYTYDARDRLLTKASPEGTLTYTYDPAGNLTSIRSSNQNGASINYSWDALNRLSTVTDNTINPGTTTYAYDAAGNVAGYAYPNGVQSTYSYNTLNRLTTLSITNSSGLLASYAYTLGPAGNLASVTELGGRNVSYGYDALYRLTGETIASDPNGINGSIGYTYDPVGNRLSRTSGVAPVPSATYGYDANDRLQNDAYDANGNTVGSGGNSYTYDFENHLTGENTGAVTIVYDGDGNRVGETANGVTTTFLVDDHNPTGYAQVLEEATGGVVRRVYAYGLNHISQNQDSGTTYFGLDGHGNVRLLTDATGAVTDRYSYDAFGTIIGQVGATWNPYLYAGEENDPNLGLYYLRARYLSQSTARFWTMDTVRGNPESPISLHKYAYVGNEPVTRQDPSGNDFVLGSIVSAVEIAGILASIVWPNYVHVPTGSPTGSLAQVEVHFDKIRSAGPLSRAHHGYILVKGALRSTIIFRGGHSKPDSELPDYLTQEWLTWRDILGLSLPPPDFGYLTSEGSGMPFTCYSWCADTYEPLQACPVPTDFLTCAKDLPLWPETSDVASVQVPNVTDSYDQVISKLTNAARVVDQLHLQYGPVRQNSNSFAHTLLVKSGLNAPSPPVWAPGWDHILY